MLWLSLLTPAAHGCSCVAPSSAHEWARIPAYGSVGVPVNVVPRWVGTSLPDPVEQVLVDGVDTPFTWSVTEGPPMEASVHFDDDLPANAIVSFKHPRGRQAAEVFTTGAHRDEGAPEWSGRYAAESIREDLGTCGLHAAHTISLEGLYDDAGVDGLLGIGVPHGNAETPIFGFGGSLTTFFVEACGGDESLADHFHRTYDVFVLDAAGHTVTGTEQVRTRPAPPPIGCDAGVTGMGWGLLPSLAVLAVARRRRRPQDRSTTIAMP